MEHNEIDARSGLGASDVSKRCHEGFLAVRCWRSLGVGSVGSRAFHLVTHQRTPSVQFRGMLMTTNPAKSILRWLILPVLSLVCWSTTLRTCQGSEARYRVVKIIEGNGTSVPEAGGINQKGQVVGSMDTFGSPRFWLWSDGVRQDLPLGTNRNCYA